MTDPQQFRDQTREWLEANCPVSQRQPIRRSEQIWGGRRRVFPNEDARLWFERMRDKGWIAPDWPVEYGGGGLSAAECAILGSEMRRLNCRPPLYDSGLWMLGPALLVHGSEDQKREHIPKIIRGEIRWCQGYSEPGAGSDLAGLQMRAEDKGDHFLVNGSKIWTTFADRADWIFCLVRTDQDAPKQKGISFLLVDMETPGVSVSPIELINGETEFCQTFFDNVKVPKANLVGKVNEGWSVANTLLKFERKMMANMDDMIEKNDRDLVAIAQENCALTESGQVADTHLRERLALQLIRANAMKASEQRLFAHMRSGIPDDGLALILKYTGTRLQQNKDRITLDILGDNGLSWDDPFTPEADRRDLHSWAFNKSLTIAGGTSEIQLNIIARKALQLPDR